MPANPLREKYIKRLIGQLRGVEVVEGQRLIAKWLAQKTPYERRTRGTIGATRSRPMF